jgi:hypothetical protein
MQLNFMDPILQLNKRACTETGVDAKSAPCAKHTASRNEAGLKHVPDPKRASQFS